MTRGEKIIFAICICALVVTGTLHSLAIGRLIDRLDAQQEQINLLPR